MIAIEERNEPMIVEPKNQRAVVVCLHCGLNTPLSESTNKRHRRAGLKSAISKIFIVRCRSCGKEAPYLADHVIEFTAFAKSAAAAAAAG